MKSLVNRYFSLAMVILITVASGTIASAGSSRIHIPKTQIEFLRIMATPSGYTDSHMEEVQFQKGLCPLDMNQPGVFISEFFNPTHQAIDIAAPPGMGHRSPEDCSIKYFFVDHRGAHAIGLECPGLPLWQLQIGHIDVLYGDTLEWYGLPEEPFRTHTVGTEIHIDPTRNRVLRKGQDLHIYVGCTGSCGFPHDHINALILEDDGKWSALDPLDFLDCLHRKAYLPLALH